MDSPNKTKMDNGINKGNVILGTYFKSLLTDKSKRNVHGVSEGVE
jgi:hypothetical protein